MTEIEVVSANKVINDDGSISEPDSPFHISREMIDLIKSVNSGGAGYNPRNDPNGFPLKKRRRKRSSSKTGNGRSSDVNSGSSSGSNSNRKSKPDDAITTKVSVTIPGYGKAIGRRETAVDIWKGIPYASPPVGSLRFAPPEAATPWAPSKLDASKYGPDCYQLTDPVANPLADVNHMSEDCLYLNVFTPAGHVARSRQGKFLNGTKQLPVMLWFHGGAFQQGAARRPEYDGRKLAERDIIVVSINYRLGALGFLVSSKDGLYGNFGKNTVEWTKRTYLVNVSIISTAQFN